MKKQNSCDNTTISKLCSFIFTSPDSFLVDLVNDHLIGYIGIPINKNIIRTPLMMFKKETIELIIEPSIGWC